jgi:V/A-type H+-transporting ATPase subunit A
MNKEGKIVKISGPLVVAKGLEDAKIGDVCFVGEAGLMAEIIKIEGEKVFLQVYEETSGLSPGEIVINTKEPLSAELGPGLIGNIFDGILRPLEKLVALEGDFIKRGTKIKTLDREKEWEFEPILKEGEIVSEGDIIGKVRETPLITFKIMVPLGIKRAKIKKIFSGKKKIEEPIAILDDGEKEFPIFMYSKWPVRISRPVNKNLEPKIPLITGQRVIDTLFPVLKGGTACVPGPFGSGKTIIQHQLAKWADAEIIIFVGCGERGNEMAEVLKEFPELKDPKSNRPLMERTILIANTSNMPIAAREASIFTGVTLGEFFRDMGYNVALMVDSTSRWAEALREMSSRLEEMPGEEGYPAYLGSKIAAFYERAGFVECKGKPERTGSLTIIGAVSPPGGDFSEPVTQNTLRVTKVFWALDEKLASARHFPAINWTKSYTLYSDSANDYFRENVSSEYPELIKNARKILAEEERLLEILRLVGFESLSDLERLILETAASIREDFLVQNAFDEIDTFCSLPKQSLMLNLILSYHQKREGKIQKEGKTFEETKIPEVEEFIKKMKYLPEKDLKEKFEKVFNTLKSC